MNKVAYIFPGQGSQYAGMSKSFFDAFASARRTFEEANDALGFDVKKLSFDGPKEELDRTEITQPAILAASIAALRSLGERTDFVPAFFAGHSLGEYTALVAAGSLDFKDAVRLVHLRGKFMQEGVHEGAGRMCAVLGLGIDAVLEVCARASDERRAAVAANINSPEQIVISGHVVAVDRAAVLAREKGAKRVIILPVSVPSHSPLMAEAAARLRRELDKVRFAAFSAPVITNVEAAPERDSSRTADLLTRQLTSPVRWVDITRRMKAESVGLVVEIGPGKVLTGLVKRIEKEMNTANLNEAADMDNVLSLLR
ncbi:MAG: ACP S-malonyltransferase [Deltaproteobacteria bacterium]|nr:ACP S-malonyltransferase [Deltaproteobacteria bacterium]